MKTRNYFLLLIALSIFAPASSAFAQSRLSYGANVNVNLAKPALYVPLSARIICEGGAIVDNRFSYSGGINVYYKASDKISLQSGLNYINTGVLYRRIYSDEEFNLQEVRNNHTVHVLEIPLNVKYKFRKGKDRGFYALAGAGIWLHLNSKLNVTERWIVGGKREYSTPDEYTTYTKFNVPFTLGFGYDYSLSEKVKLFIQPTAQITAVTMAESRDFGQYKSFSNAGLTTGIIFN